MSCAECEAIYKLRANHGPTLGGPAWDDPRYLAAAGSCVMPELLEKLLWVKANAMRQELQAAIDKAKSENQAHVVVHAGGVVALGWVPVIGPILSAIGAAAGQISIDQANEVIRRLEATAQMKMIEWRVDWCCGPVFAGWAGGKQTATTPRRRWPATPAELAALEPGQLFGLFISTPLEFECVGQPMAVDRLPELRARAVEARERAAELRAVTIPQTGYLVTPDARVTVARVVGPL